MDEEKNKTDAMTEQEIKDEKKKQEENEADSKLAHTGLKAAATYFGGAAGNAAYNLADKLGVTKPVEDLVGKAIKTTPAMNQAAKIANKVGALDAADKAIDAAGGKGGELGKETLAKETLAKDTIDSATNKASEAAIANEMAKKGKGGAEGAGTADTENDKKGSKWILIIIGIIIFLPFIIVLASLTPLKSNPTISLLYPADAANPTISNCSGLYLSKNVIGTPIYPS